MSFSLHSKRSIIPRILRDPRFSREGFHMKGTSDPKSKNFVERKRAKIRRAVDLSGVENAHLYYDHQKAMEADRQRLSRKREERQRLLSEGMPLEDVLGNLRNEEYLRAGSYHLLFNLKMLKIHHRDQVQHNLHVVHRAVTRLNCYVHFLNLFSFKTLTSTPLFLYL